MEAAAPPARRPQRADYPARFDVEYPERLSRWKIFVKWLFAIPQLIIVVPAAGRGRRSWSFIAFFAILFTKKWPRGHVRLHGPDPALDRERRSFTRFTLQRDEYPPFSGEAGEYPVTLEIDYDENLSRWMIFVKWLLAIPHLIVLAFLWIAAVRGRDHRLLRDPVHRALPARACSTSSPARCAGRRA